MVDDECRRGTRVISLPVASPKYNFHGVDRAGANLFGDCLLALDARTGKRLWHFQMVHHDIWDYDLPAQPSLITIQRNGRKIPAVAQVTKMGFVFVLDRLTGEPLFPLKNVRFQRRSRRSMADPTVSRQASRTTDNLFPDEISRG